MVALVHDSKYIEMKRAFLFIVLIGIILIGCSGDKGTIRLSKLEVSENGRFLKDSEGNPFFWLGDTGWLLFSKLTREEAEVYLDDRADKGFNVIQVMVLHTVSAKNAYGDSALVNRDVSKPVTTEGNSFEDKTEYDYWDHVLSLIHISEPTRPY